jgi:Na+/H+ antiporter NhaD/arsenite permease-like protein
MVLPGVPGSLVGVLPTCPASRKARTVPEPLPAVAACLIFLGAYLLIATEKWVGRAAAALGGAGLVLALGISDAHDAFFSEESGVDWNVVFLLLGMMIIVGVMRETGVFEYLAIWAAKRARGRAFPLMVLLILITGLASALLDNVTTVLLVAPVTILLCRRLALPVVPYLLAEVFASNIGGTATLVGDPPNIIIASRGGLSFNDFLIHLAPVVIVLLVVLIGLCRWLFASALHTDEEQVAAILALDEREAIKDRRLLVQSLVVLAVVLVAFVLSHSLGYEPSVVALLGAGLLVATTRVTTAAALQDVEWETLAFFMGLFIMVGGLVNSGVLEAVAGAVGGFADSDPLAFTGVLLWGSGLLSGVVDNIPFVAAMSPVVSDIVGPDGVPQHLWWALALGADLGGNATLIGASANVVVAGIAARNEAPISFWRFTRYGLVVAAATLVVSSGYMWLRYFVLAG